MPKIKNLFYVIKFHTLDSNFTDEDETIFINKLEAYSKDISRANELIIEKYDKGKTPLYNKSYLISFNVLDTDFTDEHETIFKKKLEAYSKDICKVNELVIEKYDKNPISLDKNTYFVNPKEKKVNEPIILTEDNTKILAKAEKEPATHTIDNMKQLLSDYRNKKISKVEFADTLLDEFMLGLNPSITDSNGKVLQGFTNFEIDNRYEYVVSRINPKLDAKKMEYNYSVIIKFRLCRFRDRIFHPYSHKKYSIKFQVKAENIQERIIINDCPISRLETVDLKDLKSTNYGNYLISAFLKIIHDASLSWSNRNSDGYN